MCMSQGYVNKSRERLFAFENGFVCSIKCTIYFWNFLVRCAFVKVKNDCMKKGYFSLKQQIIARFFFCQ